MDVAYETNTQLNVFMAQLGIKECVGLGNLFDVCSVFAIGTMVYTTTCLGAIPVTGKCNLKL